MDGGPARIGVLARKWGSRPLLKFIVAANAINGRQRRLTAAMRWCTVTELLRRVVIPLPFRRNYAKADAGDHTTIERFALLSG